VTAAPLAARARQVQQAGSAWLRRGTVGWVALLTWAVCLLAGVLLVRALGENPLTSHGVVLPLAIGIPVGMAGFGLATWVRSTWLMGVAVGGYAAWAGTTIAAALVGTPYGFGIIAGDAGRMSALVMHFSTTWHPGDAADPSLAPEYPPLYPMLIGRVAAWTGRPGWQLLQPAQVVVTSFAVVAGFLLWRRLVDDLPAFLISSAAFVSMVEPSKANEILSLAVYLPWLLGTFAVTRRTAAERPAALHPVLSGVLIGLLVPWSPQVLFLSLLSLLLVAGQSWWAAPTSGRRPMLIRWAISVGVALVVASWFVVPLARAYLSGHVQVVADLWLGSPLVADPFTIISPRPLVIAVLQIVGLVGIASQLRRTWWAAPLGLYVAGVLIERVLMLIRFTGSGHAFMLYYVAASLSYALDAAGILTLVQLWAWARPRLAASDVPVRLLGVTLSSLLVGTCAYSAYVAWAPAPRGVVDNVTNPVTPYSNSMLAHAQRLPSGAKVHFPAPNSPAGFPNDEVVAFVHQSLGPRTTPNVISDNQAVFAYNAWPDWLMPDRVAASGLTRWDYRHGLLAELARTSDPAAMATGLAQLPFGAVDVLVLRVQGPAWTFADLSFAPQAFAGPQFQISPQIGDYVVVTRVAG
jgi:hypothetical protein